LSDAALRLDALEVAPGAEAEGGQRLGHVLRPGQQCLAAPGVPHLHGLIPAHRRQAQSIGGDFESQPEDLPGLVSENSAGGAQINAPAKPGAYRLFVYALDNHGKGAYANIPFYVDTKSPTADTDAKVSLGRN